MNQPTAAQLANTQLRAMPRHHNNCKEAAYCRPAAQVCDIVGFNDDSTQFIGHISGTILPVRWHNQKCHTTGWRWLVNKVNGQSHQAQFTKT